MAFNPFTWFRKHQKVFFAGLTILCMVVFIGQFGSGDVFTVALRWFGGGRATGQTVTSLYGKKLKESELDALSRQRRIANEFMTEVAATTHPQVCRELLDKDLKSLSADSPLAGLDNTVMGIIKTRQTIEQASRFLRTIEQRAQFLLPQVQQSLKSLEDVANRDKVRDNADHLAIVRRLATVVGFQRWLAVPQELYFGGRADREGVFVDDLLDFRLWQYQADRLGIKFTDEDVKRAIVAEAAGFEVFKGKSSFEQDPTVVQFLSKYRDSSGLTGRDLLEALRQEFRVVLAQGILLGTEPSVRGYRTALGASSSPALATPDEFLNYFREQRTTMRVLFLTVPASAYLDQVKDRPTEDELRTRYDRYRDQEAFTFLRDPGFKESRRVTVEYISASPNDPFYKEVAKAQLHLWAAACALNGTPLGTLVAVTADPVRQEYEKDLKDNEPGWYDDERDGRDMRDRRANRFHYTSAMQPAGLASMVGSLTTGTPLSAIGSLALNAGVVEARTSIKFNLTHLLAASNPQTLLGQTTLLAAALPPPASPSFMQPQLLAFVQEKMADRELTKNMDKFREELMKLRGRTSAAKEYITKARKDYHLKYGAMPSPTTQEGLMRALKKKQDMGLASLREAMLQGTRASRPELMAGTIFQRVGVYDPELTSFPESSFGVSSLNPNRQDFLWWRSEDLPARTRSFSAVRSEVEEAWRLEKARQLARKEAERLEDEINKKKFNATDAERFLKEQKQGALFELDNIAQLIPPRETLAARATEYQRYQVPEEKNELIEYPPMEMAKQLLTIKQPGQATVIVDMPARNYYVAVLVERNEPKLDEFKAIYSKTPLGDTLYTRFMSQRREDHRKAILEQLRREAAGADHVDKDGRFKVPDAVRRRETTSSDE